MKQITVDYEESITRINSITIEVNDDFDEARMTDNLYDEFRGYSHPDDVERGLSAYGKIVDTCEGAEECSYEFL